jgi:hypothetical protein
LYQEEATKVGDCLIEAAVEPVGESGQYFVVLNCDSLKGLSSLVHGRLEGLLDAEVGKRLRQRLLS